MAGIYGNSQEDRMRAREVDEYLNGMKEECDYCGNGVDSDALNVCPQCGQRLCYECFAGDAMYCNKCEETMYTCDTCGIRYPEAQLRECVGCGDMLCVTCFPAGTEHCPACEAKVRNGDN
jgi:hypothetical protein